MTELPRDRGDFEAYVAGADDDNAPRRIEVRTDARYVVDAAQVVQARLVAAGHREPPRARARRDDQRVVVDVIACRRSDTLPFPVHGRDPGFEANVDAGLIVEVCRFDVEPLRGQFPGEELLRQRGALVRQPGLLADEYDRTVEAFLLQRGDDLSRGVTRTGNYDLLRQGTVPSAYQTGCSGQKKGNNIITAMNTTMVSGTPTLR